MGASIYAQQAGWGGGGVIDKPTFAVRGRPLASAMPGGIHHPFALKIGG